ncbi:MAG: hypothetical protein ACETWG_00405 [Candidatus Neomarinimicrobiota bacterium]
MTQWLTNPRLVFRLVVIGLGVVLSVLAYVTRTPFPLRKTILNLLIAIILSVLVPLVRS